MNNYNDYAQKFISHLAVSGKSQNTLKNYRIDLRAFEKFMTANVPKDSFPHYTTSYFNDYRFSLEKQGAKDNSIRRKIQTLRLFYDFLIKNHLIDHNPIKEVAVAPKKHSEIEAPDFKDVIALYLFLNKEKANEKTFTRLQRQRNVIIFHLIYGIGLKVSELKEIKKAQLFEFEGGYRLLVTRKNQANISLELPEVFNKDYQQYNELYEKALGEQKKDFNSLLFSGNSYSFQSEGISARGVEILFKEWSEELGFQVTAKSLRQACILKWLCRKTPNSRVKEWMGVQPEYSLKKYQQFIDNNEHFYSDLPSTMPLSTQAIDQDLEVPAHISEPPNALY